MIKLKQNITINIELCIIMSNELHYYAYKDRRLKEKNLLY